MHSSILALGLAALFNGAFAQNNSYSQYSIKTTYDSSNFFEAFEFFNEKDPTNGFVDYVDADAANSEGLAGYVDGAVYMGVDYQTKNPSNGRRSVRVTSHDAFTHGLFIADIAHMPGSIPGVWPAYWMFGPNWPTSGEIDILEGVSTQTENKISLHTGPGCSITNDGTTQGTTLESENCDSAGASAGCGQNTSDNQNYGDGFNDIGGGVYATEWTSDHIAVWFFHRGRIPQDIQSGNPTPSSWGPPAAKFNGGQGCNIDDHFKENNIVFDTTFCGDWAGSPDVWGKNPETSSLGDCEDYVANNPADFKNAYWLVNSIKVYVQGGSYGGGGNGTTGGGNSGSGNSGSGNSGNGNSGNGNSGNGNSGNGNSGNGNSGNGNSGNGNSGNGNSGNGNSGNGNSGNGQSENGDGQTNPPSSTQPGQDTQNGQQGQNGDGYSPDSQHGQGGGYSTGQSFDNGQYHGPGAYKTTKSQPSGTTSWDGNGWRVGSKRSVISKRYLA
ncbi:endo-1,3(4)-beta-glucanase [Fusarium verticillioides 7600]|uniref:endo-1,3(4)-beta-glucanase n=1 Tax=Gibberella moniliformis (strain M3125 / FGSC 7600) TaxID=334819 RepID=W7N874_GIBM7|nr:endo-1,3(4)-beta-glucanase [Fusarium verticillioides 7600]EWG55939.1 endo-1,3(4)-beta-glucanase [Fusarium verticillioides 7600]